MDSQPQSRHTIRSLDQFQPSPQSINFWATEIKSFRGSRENQNSPKTISQATQEIKKLGQFCREQFALLDPKHLTAEQILAYLRNCTNKHDGPLSNDTKRVKLAYIRNFTSHIHAGVAPAEIAQIRVKRSRPQDLTEKAVTRSELNAMLRVASVRSHCLATFLFESGCRCGMAAAIRIRHINRDTHGYWIRITEETPGLKTGAPSVAIPIIEFKNSMDAWLAIHPDRDNPDAFLFASLSNRNYGEGITPQSIYSVITTLARRAKIRKIHPHMLRHGSATDKIARNFQPEYVRRIHGWSVGSEMMSRYTHLGEHHRKMALQYNGIREDEANDLTCSLCIAPIQENQSKCLRCGSLQLKAVDAATAAHEIDAATIALLPTIRRNFSDILFDLVAKARGWAPSEAA